MEPLDLLNLTPLMVRTIGQAKVKIGLIDGPVAMDHPDLAGENIHQVPAKQATACSMANGVACLHGTFVAGMLLAKRHWCEKVSVVK
jgi:hypothetical protein